MGDLFLCSSSKEQFDKDLIVVLKAMAREGYKVSKKKLHFFFCRMWSMSAGLSW